MKILIVCGAGASSTFVALRLRRTAAERGLDLSVAAGSEADLPAALDGIDVLLVGPHLAGREQGIRAHASERGVAAVVLLRRQSSPSATGPWRSTWRCPRREAPHDSRTHRATQPW